MASCRRVQDSGSLIVIAEHRPMARIGDEKELFLQAGQLRQPNGADAHPSIQSLPFRPSVSSVSATISMQNAVVGLRQLPLIADLQLETTAGEVIAIHGDNGSGKTTLLRTLAGFIPLLAGKLQHAPQARIAYLPQNPTSLLHLSSVDAEITTTLRHAGMQEDPDSLCQQLGLESVRHRYPRDLSCGQRQRSALAAVLAGRPQIALLDEPTRGMDQPTFMAFIEVIQRLQENGCTIIIATHDKALAKASANRILEISDQRLRVYRP